MPKGEATGRRVRLVVVAQRCPVRGVHFPAPARSAAAWRSVQIEWHVAKLSSHAIQPPDEVAVTDDAHSNAFRYGHDNNVPGLLAVPKPYFCQRTGVGCVLELYLKAGRPLEWTTQIELAPFQVGGKNNSLLVVVESARHADADSFKVQIRVARDHLPDNLRELRRSGRRIRRRRS